MKAQYNIVYVKVEVYSGYINIIEYFSLYLLKSLRIRVLYSFLIVLHILADVKIYGIYICDVKKTIKELFLYTVELKINKNCLFNKIRSTGKSSCCQRERSLQN